MIDSVSGLLVLLDESDPALKENALSRLHQVVDGHWTEIADRIETIEELSEDESFPHAKLAAALASRCFYHLEEYSDALRLALRAGEFFDVSSTDEYEVTIVGKCIEEYIAMRTRETGGDGTVDDGEDAQMEDAGAREQLEAIVEGLFEKCYAIGSFRQALGIALEAQRLDKVEDAIVKSGSSKKEMLTHCLTLCQTIVSSRAFRLDVFDVLASLYENEDNPDYLEYAVCLHSLGRVSEFANLLVELIRPNGRHGRNDDMSFLIAYQAAFDLVELQDQKFVSSLISKLPKAEEAGEAEATAGDVEFKDRISVLLAILAEGTATAIYLDFLYKTNRTDTLILDMVKESIEQGRKNSVLHNATVMMNGFMYSGTTVDEFLRRNFDWLKQASHWAKFSATASIGVVHQGNVKSSMKLLESYLPKVGEGARDSAHPYSEGGSLYALGLIHASDGSSNETGMQALQFLTSALDESMTMQNETTREAFQHGACLGLGLVAMSSGDMELVDKLKAVLFNDNAVAGEAAALAMGMVMLGGGAGEGYEEIIGDLIGYAHDTQHEKIIRGISLAIAMAMYAQEDSADVLIEQLCRDKDPLIRYGGMFTVAMAFAGTANNSAIRRLLRVAVSDVSNDVRRAAVIALGFVMLNSPERLPQLIELLSESYNEHVRFGAALALGIGCSGMANPDEALRLLNGLIEDKKDFVRQGAMIGSSMLLMQKNPEHYPMAKTFRNKISEIVGDNKHSSTMTRMGAILATGIIDAGGRNVNIQLMARTGVTRPPAVIGMLLFSQYWFWYPLLNMLCLTFSPTALIGVNANLDLPNGFRVECDSNLAKFDYPKFTRRKKDKKQVKVKTAVLSTTAKAKARAMQKKLKRGEAMDVDEEEKKPKKDEDEEEKMDVDDEDLEIRRGEALSNPIRVTRTQKQHIVFLDNQRYTPVSTKDNHKSGIVVLRDSTPDQPETVTKVEVPPTGGGSGREAAPPNPFTYRPR